MPLKSNKRKTARLVSEEKLSIILATIDNVVWSANRYRRDYREIWTGKG